MARAAGSNRSTSPKTAKASLQTRKQEFARDAIWTAAIDLFADRGFEETTIDDIVDAAGTSRRTFFRYFESKRDLMAQPVVSYGAALTREIESSRPGGSPAELFRRVVREVARSTVSDPRMRKVMEISARYPAAREAQVSRVAELQERLAEAFAIRCEDAITAHALAALTLSALSLSYRIWFAQGRRDVDSAVEQVFERLGGIAGR
ncbi:MAG: TetR family transcriptional regulator [Acidobacteria bacterium]|nr:TetR family transcriptional regulator [Acidobacteriota bacterium]